jgi:hypothetical protein
MRIFGPKRENVIADLRKLYNEVLHNLHSATDIASVTISSRTKWVALMEK